MATGAIRPGSPDDPGGTGARAHDDGYGPVFPPPPTSTCCSPSPPRVIALSPSADVRIWIVLDGGPPAVREAAGRLGAGPLPPGVTRIRVR